MHRQQNPNLEILEAAVIQLGPLADRMVFLAGGMPQVSCECRLFCGGSKTWLGSDSRPDSHTMEGAMNYTLRQPLGVVYCISPRNLPGFRDAFVERVRSRRVGDPLEPATGRWVTATSCP